MIKSMTGFGRYENVTNDYKVTVEIKSVNHRYLDVNIKLLKKFGMFESRIRNSRQRFLAKQELPDLSFIIRYQCFLHTEFKEEMTL